MSKTYDLPVEYDSLDWRKGEKRAVRQQYIQEQQNMCFYCKERLDQPAPERIRDKKIDWSLFPDNFLKSPVHLQHDHDTGLTEGAVHNYCNAVMWQYEGR